MSKRIFMRIFIILLFSLTGNALAADINMKEGLWEITITVEETDEKPIKMKITQCLTKEKDNFIPYKISIEKEGDMDCQVIKYEVKSNTVTWAARCKDEEGISTGNGKVNYKGDTFEGIVKMKDPDGETTIKMRGKWIGKCPKEKRK